MKISENQKMYRSMLTRILKMDKEQLIKDFNLQDIQQFGIEQKEKEVVINMLKNNEPDNKIIKYTNITKAELEKIKKELKNKKDN